MENGNVYTGDLYAKKSRRLSMVGTVTWIGPVKSGTTQSKKPWKSVDFALEWREETVRKGVILKVFGDGEVDRFVSDFRLGDHIRVGIVSLTVSQWQGRLYQQANAYHIERIKSDRLGQEAEADEALGADDD